MNNFLLKVGVPPKVQIVDVYSLEPDMLAIVPQPVLALLLLFPCDEEVSICFLEYCIGHGPIEILKSNQRWPPFEDLLN